MNQLKPGCHIHLIGICGTAMASLAGILKERGFKVTGSDQNVYPPMSTFLQEQGIEIMQGYKAENLTPAPDFVVVGNVISAHYEEAVALLKSDIPYASLPETLRDIVIEDRHSLVVAGTHGKTTTTSMLAWVCQQEGLKPGFLIGGIPNNFHSSFQNPGGEHWVIEGDEYDTAFFAKVPKFIYYKPRSVILTGIEFDHADIYKDLSDVLKAFESLLDIIPKQTGLLVYNKEDENIPKILTHYQGQKVSYGFSDGDWTIDQLQFKRKGLDFDVLYKGKHQDHLFLPMFGQYNVTNALAVYAMAKELGMQLNLQQALAEFRGVKRRQELIGEPNGIQVIEDFAHHPTAVRSTIESFQKREGKGRLFVVFEPRSNTSRRRIFQQAFTEALALADEVFICRPQSGTQNLETKDLLDVDKMVADLPVPGLCFSQVEEAIGSLKEKAQPGDTVLIMSNGAFQEIYRKILVALEG